MKIILVIFSFLFVQFFYAQDGTKDSKVTDKNLIYNLAGLDVMPEFPGGLEEFYKYIAKNFRIPEDKNFKGGKIFAQFTIEKDGSITVVKVTHIGFGTKKETTRILEESPKWSPGAINGRIVRCSYTLPITLQGN